MISRRGDLRDRGEWKHISTWGGKRIISWPTLLPQVCLHNRFESLEFDGQSYYDVDEGLGLDPSDLGQRGQVSLLPISWPLLSSEKGLLSSVTPPETEGLICWPDPTHIKVCCLARAWVKDITRKHTSLLQPSDCYSFVFHVSSNEAEKSKCDPKGLQDLGTIG